MESITKEDIKKIFLYSTVGELRRATSTKPTEMVEGSDSMPRLYYREERNPETNQVQYTVHAVDADVIKFLWNSQTSSEETETPTEEPTEAPISGTPVATEEELVAAIAEGGEIALTDNVQLAQAAVIETESKLNLNGNTITGGVFAESNGSMTEGDTDSYALWVKDGGNLTIDGEGEVKSQSAKYSMAVWAQGGTVTINGGKFSNEGEGSDLIYASAGGKVYINGGEFHANKKQEGVDGTQEDYSALNIKDADRSISEIVVKGGKFYGFNPASNTSEGPGTNFVAEGYESVEVEEGVWEVKPIA